MRRLLLLTAVACGAPASPAPSVLEGPVVLHDPQISALEAAWTSDGRWFPEATGDSEPHTVLLAILDTVRADRTSLCGHDRPTTPHLEALAAETGTRHRCDAYSPGAWTLPSHASFFTGLAVPDHGVTGPSDLDPDVPVLAEAFQARGYQTVLLSANPTLGASPGLLRGFDHVVLSPNLRQLRADMLPRALRDLLATQLSDDRPLFLVLNILDAHDPYPAVPEGVPWLPAQDVVPLDAKHPSQDRPFHRFVRGELPPRVAEELLERVRNGYDWGVHEADKVLRRTLAVLHPTGRLERGLRLAITSDHGEFLGEHRLLRHGCFAWQPVVTVPLLWRDTTASAADVELPSPLSARHVHDLLLHGRLEDDLPPPASYTRARRLDARRCADMAAVWTSPDEKHVSLYGDYWRFDLGADPLEHGHEALAEGPGRAAIEAAAAALEASIRQESTQPVDEGPCSGPRGPRVRGVMAGARSAL